MPSNHNAGSVYNIDGISPTVMNNHGLVVCILVQDESDNSYRQNESQNRQHLRE